MITAERLRELIKQEATIYAVVKEWLSDRNELKMINLDEKYFIECWNGNENNPILKYTMFTYYSEEDGCDIDDTDEIAYLKDCFETQEQAEWHLKTNITKEVKLPHIPTWEELPHTKYISFNFYNQEGYECELSINGEFNVINVYSEKLDKFVILKDNITKENYIKAVDKFISLWLED